MDIFTIILDFQFSFSKAMGLLTILRKVKEKERELRLLLLGLDNAGKTTVRRIHKAYMHNTIRNNGKN